MEEKEKLKREIIEKIFSNKKEAKRVFKEIERKIKENYLLPNPPSFSLLPVFLKEKEKKELKRVSEKIFKIIEKILFLYFKGEKEIVSKISFPLYLKKLILIDPGYPYLLPISRMDFIFSKDGPKLLEINSNPGMIGDYLHRSELFYHHPFFKEIFKRYHLCWENYSKKFLKTLIKCYQRWGGKKKRPIIGILFSSPGLPAEQILLPKLFSKLGYFAFLLDFQDRNFSKNFKKADLIYRKIGTRNFFFKFSKKKFPSLGDLKRICLINPLRSYLGGLKEILVRLSSGEFDKFLKKEEREIVEKNIPQTILLKEKCLFKGEKLNPLSYFLLLKDSYVLKSSSGEKGEEIYIGKEISQRRWLFLLKRGVKKSWIIQEFISPPQEFFPEFEKERFLLKKMKINHNVLLFNGKYGACFSRISKGYISNISQGGKAIPTFSFF